MEHEPGREPTDAELLTALFFENSHGTPESFEAAELAAIQRGEEITNRGSVPHTPAPDEAGQLRAEVARLNRRVQLADAPVNRIVAIIRKAKGGYQGQQIRDTEQEDELLALCNAYRASAVTEAAPMPADTEQDETLVKLIDLLTRTANAVKGDPGEMKQHGWADLPELCAALSARVAELEAELEMVKADKISVWAALLATGKVIEEELMRLAGPEPNVEMVGGPTHTAPGKEPTSE